MAIKLNPNKEVVDIIKEGLKKQKGFIYGQKIKNNYRKLPSKS